MLDPEREQRTLSPAEIEARGGLEVDEIRLLMQTAGLPPPDPDEPSFTEDEAKIFQEIRKMREVWTPELGLQVSRVAGRSLARIAHTQVQLFRLHVLEVDTLEVSSHRLFTDPECPECAEGR